MFIVFVENECNSSDYRRIFERCSTISKALLYQKRRSAYVINRDLFLSKNYTPFFNMSDFGCFAPKTIFSRKFTNTAMIFPIFKNICSDRGSNSSHVKPQIFATKLLNAKYSNLFSKPLFLPFNWLQLSNIQLA